MKQNQFSKVRVRVPEMIILTLTIGAVNTVAIVTMSGMSLEQQNSSSTFFLIRTRGKAFACSHTVATKLTVFFLIYFWSRQLKSKGRFYYYCTKVSGNEIISLFSISLCPVESLWSSISLWKIYFILHYDKSTLLLGHLDASIVWITEEGFLPYDLLLSL